MQTILIVGLLAATSLFNVAFSKDRSDTIRHAGFEQFIQGSLGNSGANIYVSQSGRVQVNNLWDLNKDGYLDVLISNSHDVFEIVDAFIYWGNERGIRSLLPELWSERPLAQVVFGLMDSTKNVTRLPAFGGGRSLIADLNRDGYPEIVFCNYIHNYPGIRAAFVYWGSAEGYKPNHRTDLPTNWAAGVTAADLNGDGYPELVFANQGAESGSEEISPVTGLDSYIYWGSATGFSPSQVALLKTLGARDVTVADINKDRYPDLAFIHNSPEAKGVQVFWGSAAGYSNDRSQSLPLPDPTSVRSSDLNGDGFSDLVITTVAKQETTLEVIAEGKRTAQHAAYILMGGADGLDPRRRVLLPSHEARDSCIGDFNQDGFLDVAIANASDGSTSETASFIYWGSAKGFFAEPRSQLPTLGATGVASADLNRDGFADLIFANSSDEQTYDVPSYVYWGSRSGFAPYLRSDLQSFGAASVNIGDMNGDGLPDVLMVNQYSGKALGKTSTTIYWGNPHHYYSTASMVRLPGLNPYDTTVADLNDDGCVDIVLCNPYSGKSYLYWGSKSGFSPGRPDELPIGAWGSSAADLNRDGYLDLVFTHRQGNRNVGTILWGSGEGYSEKRKTPLSLKNKRSRSNVVADLNRDGFLDLAFPDEYFGVLQIYWGSAQGFSESNTWAKFLSAGSLELADLNGDGFLDFVIAGGFDPERKSRNTSTHIFWGTAEGTPSLVKSIELEAYGSLECSVADLNRDGNLDLVLSNYMSDSTRALPLFIYWGSRGGHYSNSHRTDLPAESSAGVQTLDLNRDGYPEIIIHNHLKNGDHSINSYIYWNGPQGFNRDRRTELPTWGPHYSQMTDSGNLYTRKMEEEYISPVITIPSEKQVRRLSWRGEEPHGAKLKFQIRSAATSEALRQSNWMGPEGENSFYQISGADLSGLPPGNRWMQYRAVFTSPDGGEWPVLTEVELGLK